MKRHLQCAEQQVSRSNLTEYCAKLHCEISDKIFENRWNVISNAGTIRAWSENDPSMIREWSENDPSMIRAWKRKPQPASQVRLLFEVPRSIFYCKIQRFEPNLTFKHSPSAAPATKSNTWPSPNTAPATQSNTWPSPNTAPTTKSDTWTSPNTAPTTKSNTWTSPSTAPTTKSNTWTSPSTAPATKSDTWTSPNTGATGVTIQPHQILRLSRSKTHILSPHRIWNLIYSARSNRCHDPTSPNTAPVTQKDSHT